MRSPNSEYVDATNRTGWVVEGHSHNETPAPMAPSKLQLCTLDLPYKLFAALLCTGQALCLAKAVYYVWKNYTVILLVPGAP